MTPDELHEAIVAAQQHLGLLVAAALTDMGEDARDLDGGLPVTFEGVSVTVSRPDGSRIITVPLRQLYTSVTGREP